MSLQASQCFVLDLDQRAFLAAVKDRKAAGMAPVPATDPHMNPAADNSSRLSSGPIVVDPATYFGSSTSSGFSNSSWPVGQSVLDFFWGELTLSEGAPFECLTPDGKSTVSIQPRVRVSCCFLTFLCSASNSSLHTDADGGVLQPVPRAGREPTSVLSNKQ
jgi:hypothetical protein